MTAVQVSPPSMCAAPAPLDVAAIKADHPILSVPQRDGKRLVFLDSAASSQRPVQVTDAMTRYYETHHANVHRGAYLLAEQATGDYEGARARVARFIGARSAEEVIFTKNATEAINLVAGSWGRANLGAGDVVVLSEMEHHANIVPWQMLQAEKGFSIRFIGVTDDGLLDTSNLDALLDGARLLGVTAMSNVLGTLNDIPSLAAAAHAAGALVLVDGCQSVPHTATDVQAMGADFLVFSAHKMLGPTGIGVLWGRAELLNAMPPFLGGGGMIRDVRLDGFTAAEVPARFEAGTPPIAEAVGLGAAIDYLDAIGMDRVRAHEHKLTAYALGHLSARYGDDLVIHGPRDPNLRGGVMSMAYKDIHPHDLAQVLDQAGIAVRPAHHCAKPLMRRLGVGATARASWYVYNDEADIDALVEAIGAADALFS